jgi:hypothetical protein
MVIYDGHDACGGAPRCERRIQFIVIDERKVGGWERLESCEVVYEEELGVRIVG